LANCEFLGGGHFVCSVALFDV